MASVPPEVVCTKWNLLNDVYLLSKFDISSFSMTEDNINIQSGYFADFEQLKIDSHFACFGQVIIDPSALFLGGAPTSICHFFGPSVHPFVHLSVVHHISGTVYHLIIIFGTHM